MSSSHSCDLAARIAAARNVPGAPDPVGFREHHTVPAMLAAHLADRPDQEALVYLDDDDARSVYTYAVLADAVARTSGFLRDAGVGRGDRVATVAHNHPDTVIQYLATWSLGAVIVPVNVGEDDDRILYILDNSRARLVFVRDVYRERILALQDDLPGLETMVVCGEADPDRPSFAEALAHAPTDKLAAEPDDEALIVYTSGTTGHPKGVVLTQSNLLVDATQIARWHGMTPGERMMCVLPIHHVNGTVVTLVTPLVYGGTTVLNRKFQTDRFLPRLADERIGVVSVVPTLLSFLLQGAKAGTVDTDIELSDFRHIICGAGPLTVELALQFQDQFGLRIVHGYGLSETTCYSCFLPVELDDAAHRRWLGDHGFPAIGMAIPSNEMDIHDDAGRQVPAGERGEIVVRGHNVMAGYYHNDEANVDAFTHGWFRSGDEGFWLPDENGRAYFFITGRLKELIIRGGVNVSPLEIDEVLMSLPGVAAGVSVGFENTVYGEEVGAYVVMHSEAVRDDEAILEACRKELPHHKCPKVVVFGDEVPVTSTGKYRRSELKHLFVEWRSVQFKKNGA